jgi:hypothetical protein
VVAVVRVVGGKVGGVEYATDPTWEARGVGGVTRSDM